jgi:Zn-finger nucleic acid-binding protein
MLCPRDETDLKTILADGHTLQRCAECGGAWISRKTLDRLAHLNAKMPGKAPLQPPAGTSFPETKCLIHKHETMNQVVIEDVEIDVCVEGDGIWLDGGECQRIIDRRGRYCKRDDPTLDDGVVATEMVAGAAAGAVLAPTAAAVDVVNTAGQPAAANQSSVVGDVAGEAAGDILGELAAEGAVHAAKNAGDLAGAAAHAVGGVVEAPGGATEAASGLAGGAVEVAGGTMEALGGIAEIGGVILEGVGELAAGILDGIASGF